MYRCILSKHGDGDKPSGVEELMKAVFITAACMA